MVDEYKIKLHKKAIKDKNKIKSIPALKRNAEELVEILKKDPFKSPPSYEELGGDLKGMYSRRLNRKHRLVYTVDRKEKVVKILSMWTHYGD
jgi:Txe/YoeB family toxin of toxin-antitoxin system